jgi:enamine deaminase RidA (YjgF/YER057c/UK114 family)
MVQIERFTADPPERPRSYSQAVRYGSLIITAGHLAAEPEIEASIEEQTHSALRELLVTVERAGGSAGSILRINAYLATMDDFESYTASTARSLVSRSGPHGQPFRLEASNLPTLLRSTPLPSRSTTHT